MTISVKNVILRLVKGGKYHLAEYQTTGKDEEQKEYYFPCRDAFAKPREVFGGHSSPIALTLIPQRKICHVCLIMNYWQKIVKKHLEL